jgi:hypothetical protein
MSLGVVLAPRPSPTAKPSPSPGLGLGTTGIEIIIGVVAALVLVSLTVAWITSRDWRRRRHFRRQTPRGSAASLAVRSAFARGDYMAVIDLREGKLTAGAKLLLAQSYARIGADGPAANAASEAIKAILEGDNWSAAESTRGISVLETRALRSWLDRLAGADEEFNPERLAALRESVLGPVPATPEEPVQLSSELDEIRQRVAAEGTAAKAAGSRYQWINLGTGVLAGGLAAASGVLGVAKGPLGLIALLAFLSAGITAILTTLKPAEREKESKLRADALGQLAAAIDFFEIDRPHDARVLLPAVKEVHERLAIAEGHAKIVPLGASSRSTARRAITSISPTEGPEAGGQNLTITGTGFTGVTSVRFGKIASSFQVVSDTQITVTTPPQAAGSVRVTVAGPGGTSPDNPLAHYAYTADSQSPP